MRGLEEARSAKIFVIALRIDIGPELARTLRNPAFARQILAAVGDRRGKAEVEAEQGRLLGRPLQHPREDLLTRP